MPIREETEDLIKQAISGVDFDAYFAIGSANARYIACILEGGFASNSYFKVGSAYHNVGADDYALVFGIPLPFFLGSKKLYIDQIQIGLPDADAGDYIDWVRLTKWTAYETQSIEVDDSTNRTSPEEYDYDFAAEDLSDAKRVFVTIKCIATNADDLDISYVLVRYYYDD